MRSFLIMALLAVISSCSPSPSKSLPKPEAKDSPMEIVIDELKAQITGAGLVLESPTLDLGSIPKKAKVKASLYIENMTNTSKAITLDLSALSPVVTSSNCPASLLTKRACVINFSLDTALISSGVSLNKAFSINGETMNLTAEIADEIAPVNSISYTNRDDFSFDSVAADSGVFKKTITLVNLSSYSQEIGLDYSELDNISVVKTSCVGQLKTKRVCFINIELDTSGLAAGEILENITIQGQPHAIRATITGGSSSGPTFFTRDFSDEEVYDWEGYGGEYAEIGGHGIGNNPDDGMVYDLSFYNENPENPGMYQAYLDDSSYPIQFTPGNYRIRLHIGEVWDFDGEPVSQGDDSTYTELKFTLGNQVVIIPREDIEAARDGGYVDVEFTVEAFASYEYFEIAMSDMSLESTVHILKYDIFQDEVLPNQVVLRDFFNPNSYFISEESAGSNGQFVMGGLLLEAGQNYSFPIYDHGSVSAENGTFPIYTQVEEMNYIVRVHIASADLTSSLGLIALDAAPAKTGAELAAAVGSYVDFPLRVTWEWQGGTFNLFADGAGTGSVMINKIEILLAE